MTSISTMRILKMLMLFEFIQNHLFSIPCKFEKISETSSWCFGERFREKINKTHVFRKSHHLHSWQVAWLSSDTHWSSVSG